jgi:hypothetical protein
MINLQKQILPYLIFMENVFILIKLNKKKEEYLQYLEVI